MDKLKNNGGITLVEILIASSLASVVFLAVASVYVSGLRLLNSTQDVNSLDPALAMNLMSKNIALANQVTVQSISTAGDQLTLRLDYNNNAGVPTIPKFTADTSDDFYILYRFIGTALKTRFGAATPDVAAGDTEVIPGLTMTAGSFTLYNPVDKDGNANGQSNAVTISIASNGRTLVTTTAVGAGRKSQT